jgi:hypothetical protein
MAITIMFISISQKRDKVNKDYHELNKTLDKLIKLWYNVYTNGNWI